MEKVTTNEMVMCISQ